MVESTTAAYNGVNVDAVWNYDPEFRPLMAKFKDYKLLEGSTERRLKRISDASIIKRFELTPFPEEPTDVVCPHFLELKWGYGCPYDCAWCFLKGTLRMLPDRTAPKTKSRKKILRHVLSALVETSKPELFNTGELCDSLMDERNDNPFSKWIVDIFQQQNRHKVLFVTKSGYVEKLLEIEDHSQAIASFSLNAPTVSKKWEKAPPVSKRIPAASRLADAGWEVRARIDPMVPVPDWKTHYEKLVDQIFTHFTPNRITLGTLRGLQSTLNNIKDDSWTKYLDGENTGWGKKTNDDLREEMYLWVLECIEDYMNLNKVGLCKETLDMFDRLDRDFTKQVCNCIL